MASMFAGLDAEAYDRQYSDRQLLSRIAAYFRPHGRRMVWLAVLVAIMALAGAAVPITISRGVAAAAVGGRPAPAAIGALVGIVLLAGVVTWAANLGRRRASARVIGDVVLALRRDAFAAAVAHDLSFYDEFSSGRIVSRITSDTQDFGQVIVLIADLFNQIAQVLILGAILVTISWQLTLLLIGTTPLVGLMAMAFRRVARQVTRQGFRAMANVNALIQESVTGIVVAKNFRQEAAIYDQFAGVNLQSYAINVRRGFVMSTIFPVLNALAGVGTALLVYFGGSAATAGAIGLGAWYLFIQSLDAFWSPVTNISAFWSQFQSGLSAAERVFALMDAETRVVQRETRPVPRLRGEIEFEGVNFRYGSAQREVVLSHFSLTIGAGENVALVGHTGAGKSSIVKLIARFYEFEGGRLSVDGHDVRTFDLRDYRRQLGIVSQSPFLFAGTVLDNIRYARPQVGELEIRDLARQIGGGEWLEALPEGLQTQAGERGARLSLGQRQLVALMRVLVQRPPIFILDEATASVDPFTESQIQEALDLILANSTSILIAHRLSTVRSVDRIIVLRQGQIIETGDHRSLLAQGGHYAELYNTYFRHQAPDFVAGN
ncbi:MAG: ABC transporter ATP-binding protein [Chloroflexi bacterium]|nr:ABC transporter ATP-binding protein [Chloroflexota bacterium]